MTKFITTGPDLTTKTRSSKAAYVAATWINYKGEGWECKSFHKTAEAARAYEAHWTRSGNAQTFIDYL